LEHRCRKEEKADLAALWLDHMVGVVHLELKVEIWFDIATGPDL
jgi:hypothetical protein